MLEVDLLYKYEKHIIAKEAQKSGFIRDTLEKVYRLVDTLEYINRIVKHPMAMWKMMNRAR